MKQAPRPPRLVALHCGTAQASASRHPQIHGVRSNQLIGYGLVSRSRRSATTTQTPFTTQSMGTMLATLGVISRRPSSPASSSRTWAVIVTSSLPSSPNRDRISRHVSSLGNAKSLRGGTLLMTPMKGADGNVYAWRRAAC